MMKEIPVRAGGAIRVLRYPEYEKRFPLEVEPADIQSQLPRDDRVGRFITTVHIPANVEVATQRYMSDALFHTVITHMVKQHDTDPTIILDHYKGREVRVGNQNLGLPYSPQDRSDNTPTEEKPGPNPSIRHKIIRALSAKLKLDRRNDNRN